MLQEETIKKPVPPVVDPDIKTDKQFGFVQRIKNFFRRLDPRNIDWRQFYRNGAFYIGRVNMYGVWNDFCLWMFKMFTRTKYNAWKK